METELEPVVRLLAEHRWPWRLHATYDETISRALDVYEKVNRDIPFNGLPWFFDHCETISARNIDRIAALGGGIAIQHRMAFQGEYFVERYGRAAAERTPPIQRMLKSGVPVGAGTDATRVASYNPWVALGWLVSGRTVGGMTIYKESNRLEREAALRLFTEANTWFSGEDGKKGQIKVGQLADLAVLSDDYFAVAEEKIADITSVLTLLGGTPVHASGDFSNLAPPLPQAMPDWSPVRYYGGYQGRTEPDSPTVAVARAGNVLPHRCESGPWGDFGCACWAF
jgi:predicted amidohydrolase YtcJ